MGPNVSAGAVLSPCLLQDGAWLWRLDAELSTAQDIKFFILEVLGPSAVPGREDEQSGPMTGWTGWGVRGD